MQNLLYIIAVFLLITWVIGFFIYTVGSIIHLLLVFAVIALLLRIMGGKKPVDKNGNYMS